MSTSTLPPNHFLSLPRQNAAATTAGVVDRTTLAAHDFDVDTRTGFLPPQPPLSRLPATWEPWEVALQNAIESKLQLGEKSGLTEEEKYQSEVWRNSVRKLPIIPTEGLQESIILLRRGHQVLSFILHFYIHTLPPSAPILVPKSIGVPSLQVANYLSLPVVQTYSDNGLYNWKYREAATPTADGEEAEAEEERFPTPSTIRSQTLFTSLMDEEEFYLASTRIELVGVEALELMGQTMDEAFIGDNLALSRIASYLSRLAIVIREMAATLLRVRDGCDPETFYHVIRPWFRGEDATPGGRKWVFEGIEEYGLKKPTELAGASAGQSALIQSLDIFLCVGNHPTPLPSSTPATPPLSALGRMTLYMPRHHRHFLHHLSANPRPLRDLVAQNTTDGANPELLEGYNAAVAGLRAFRDAHLRIVALYIVGPSRRIEAGKRQQAAASAAPAVVVEEAPTLKDGETIKGTGGTELIPFLKGLRDKTTQAAIKTD